jgi:hypothetical protein
MFFFVCLLFLNISFIQDKYNILLNNSFLYFFVLKINTLSRSVYFTQPLKNEKKNRNLLKTISFKTLCTVYCAWPLLLLNFFAEVSTEKCTFF